MINYIKNYVAQVEVYGEQLEKRSKKEEKVM